MPEMSEAVLRSMLSRLMVSRLGKEVAVSGRGADATVDSGVGVAVTGDAVGAVEA